MHPPPSSPIVLVLAHTSAASICSCELAHYILSCIDSNKDRPRNLKCKLYPAKAPKRSRECHDAQPPAYTQTASTNAIKCSNRRASRVGQVQLAAPTALPCVPLPHVPSCASRSHPAITTLCRRSIKITVPAHKEALVTHKPPVDICCAARIPVGRVNGCGCRTRDSACLTHHLQRADVFPDHAHETLGVMHCPMQYCAV